VDEDYFIGLNFPETSLQPSKVLYSKEADKYYAAGMEKPYQDNTSFMLSLLGIDFDAESEEKVVGKRMERQAYHKKPSYELSYRGKTVKAIYHDSYHQNLRGKGFYSFMGIPELEGYDIADKTIGIAKVRFKRWVDKYYEKTNRGNTEFMLSLLGIDFDAEWVKLLFSAETKSPAQKSLDKWTKEDWGTKSGKPSTQGSQATGERYLPRKAREALTDKEYARTSAKKRRDMKQGKQFSQQPDDIEEKTAKYRSEVFEAIEGTGSNARFTDQPDPKIYRDPALRQKARNKLLKGNKGGDEGEWSARKAQMAATEYRKMYENKYGVGKNPYF